MWIVPLILVATIFAAGIIIWRRAKLREPDFALPAKPLLELTVKDLKPLVDRLTYRLAWFATATVFFIVSLSSIFVSVMVIREMRSDNFGRILIIGLASLAAIITLVVWLKRSKQHSGPLFLEELIANTSEKFAPHWFVGLGNALAFIGVAFFIGGSCSIIASTGRSAEDVSRQMHDLGILLYAGAAFLVASVLEINQLHRWSGDCVSEDVRPEIHRAAAVLAGTVGTFFSLLLAAAYVPAVVILQYRGAPVHQTVSSALQSTFNLALVLSPLLVGLASSHWNSSSWTSSQ
jgi:hypothetical protein